VNRHPTFEIKMPILLSFFGAFLILWFFIYNRQSKIDRQNSCFPDSYFPLP
jgi:cbb3-type cytochrome oxidase subunit 3